MCDIAPNLVLYDRNTVHIYIHINSLPVDVQVFHAHAELDIGCSVVYSAVSPIHHHNVGYFETILGVEDWMVRSRVPPQTCQSQLVFILGNSFGEHVSLQLCRSPNHHLNARIGVLFESFNVWVCDRDCIPQVRSSVNQGGIFAKWTTSYACMSHACEHEMTTSDDDVTAVTCT